MQLLLEDALIEVLVHRLDDLATGGLLADWATQALVEGLDTTSLVYLAGLPRDCSLFEAVPLLDKALTELGLLLPEPAALRRAYVGVVSRALLAGEVGVRPALQRIHQHAVGPLGHPADLMPWCYTWESLDAGDFHTLSASEVTMEARRLASHWAIHRAFPASDSAAPRGGGA